MTRDFLKPEAKKELEAGEFGERQCSNCMLRIQAPFLYCQYAMGFAGHVKQLTEFRQQLESLNGGLDHFDRSRAYMKKLPIIQDPIDADDLAKICKAFVPIKPLRESPRLER